MTARAWTCAIAAVLAAAACTDARQIVLSIDTTAGVPCDIDRIRIRAASTTFERSLRGARLPVAITLADDTPTGTFDLDVIGLAGEVEVMRASDVLQFASRETTVPVVLDPRCSADAHCPLSDPAAPPISARFQCGPAVSGYAIEKSLESFHDACMVPGPHTGRVLIDGSRGPVRLDDLQGVLPGFGFRFYGKPIHQIWIHSHGYISFGRDNPDPNGALNPGPLDRNIVGDGAAPPARSVMAFWDALTVRPTVGVCYYLDGAPGKQVFRATWARACLTTPCAGDNLNFTITLNENSQTISVVYSDMIAGNPDRARGALATVGVVDEATGCPATARSTATGRCTDGTPCGYSQVFSQTIQVSGIENVQFTPRADD